MKSESCVQYSATPMIPIFQIQKSFLILIILYFPMAFGLLKRFSSSSRLLNTLLFYLLGDFFSHLYHLRFILSSYVLVLSKPMFFPLFHYFFFKFFCNSVTVSSSQEDEFRVYLASRSSLYLLLPLPK